MVRFVMDNPQWVEDDREDVFSCVSGEGYCKVI
jgi:hypothetical protein